MSAKARALRTLYRRHLITLEGVQKALNDGIITYEEYEWIVG